MTSRLNGGVSGPHGPALAPNAKTEAASAATTVTKANERATLLIGLLSPAADLAVRQALCNQGEHVELAIGQGRQVRPALPPRAQAGKVRPEEREERTIAFVEVKAGPSFELEEARVAGRRR